MTTLRIRPILAALAVAASLLAAHGLYAQSSGGPYTMRKEVIGAGATSTVGAYRLTGTVGEPGAALSNTPRFRLTGGFHGPVAPVVDAIFCDGFESTTCP